MRAVRDDRGRDVTVFAPPRRIVSLVPSDTWNLFALGAGERVVGRTDYCCEPHAQVAAIPTLGGTKNPRVQDILDLSPDLVVANQEENSRGDLERLAQAGVNVYVSFPKRVADGLAHLAKLARLLGVERDTTARDTLRRGYHALAEAERSRSARPPLRAFLPIWMDPLMTIHGDTFISDALDLAGAYNVFSDRARRYPLAADLGRAEPLPVDKVAGRDTRYPRVTLDEVHARAPEIVLLTDEPHPFSEADAAAFRALDLPANAHDGIVFADGKAFSWYGAMCLDRLASLRAVIDQVAARAVP